MLCDYVKEEIKREERVVYQNAHFIALVPFWVQLVVINNIEAVWPFEVMVLSKKCAESVLSFDSGEVDALAECLRTVTCRYVSNVSISNGKDALFECSFPYSMGIHQAKDMHFHIHFYPPLLRSATGLTCD